MGIMAQNDTTNLHGQSSTYINIGFGGQYVFGSAFTNHVSDIQNGEDYILKRKGYTLGQGIPFVFSFGQNINNHIALEYGAEFNLGLPNRYQLLNNESDSTYSTSEYKDRANVIMFSAASKFNFNQKEKSKWNFYSRLGLNIGAGRKFTKVYTEFFENGIRNSYGNWEWTSGMGWAYGLNTSFGMAFSTGEYSSFYCELYIQWQKLIIKTDRLENVTINDRKVDLDFLEESAKSVEYQREIDNGETQFSGDPYRQLMPSLPMDAIGIRIGWNFYKRN